MGNTPNIYCVCFKVRVQNRWGRKRSRMFLFTLNIYCYHKWFFNINCFVREMHKNLTLPHKAYSTYDVTVFQLYS